MFIYDITTGKLLQTLKGHSSYITSCSFSADGRYVVSASENGHIYVWDASTGQCLQKVFEKNSKMLKPIFCHNGRQIQFVRQHINKEGKIGLSLCTWDFLPLEELKAQVRSRFKDTPLTPEERRQYYLE